MATESGESVDAFDSCRQFFAVEPDVLVLSVAMLVFSLAFQMTTRYVPEYMYRLGAGASIVGLYGSDWTVQFSSIPGLPALTVAFGLATAIGLAGVAYFAAFGREFEAYA